MCAQKLPPSFYRQPDVVSVARQLVGKVLCTARGDERTSGIITETEAYCGRGDRASHAHDGNRTDRTESMYRPGGIAYVYLCYGIHHLFNVVTNVEGKADAVLIRAIKPVEGIPVMLRRRNADSLRPALTAGPGRLSQALAITTGDDTTSLTGDTIWIEDRNLPASNEELVATSRIGVHYAEEDANLPWRFYPRDNRWISQK